MADTPNYTRLHLIAIGGSIMHNLALALRQKGISVSGSDDEIYEPARTRLQRRNLLPETEGWNPDRISPDLDAVIVAGLSAPIRQRIALQHLADHREVPSVGVT